MKNIKFVDDGHIFNCRVAGTCLHDNKVLLCRFENGTYQTFIGGKVKFDETSNEAIIREMNEETNASLEIDHMVALIENLFRIDKQNWHQYIFFYLLKDNQNELPYFEGERYIADDNKAVYRWFDITELASIDIRPKCGLSVLNNLQEQNIMHIINKDNR